MQGKEHRTGQICLSFNGKELDEMTGLYYYGARYMSPRESFFLGGDPLAGKYPHMSPYTYALNNPLRFIDPTGMEIENPPTHTVQKDETLWRISRYYNMTTTELRELNGMAPDETLIKPGQELKVRDNWPKPKQEQAKVDATGVKLGKFHNVGKIDEGAFYDGFENGIPYWGTNESGEDATGLKSKHKEQMEDMSPLTPSPYNIGNVFDFFKMLGFKGGNRWGIRNKRPGVNDNGTVRDENGNVTIYSTYPHEGKEPGDTLSVDVPGQLMWNGKGYQNTDKDSLIRIQK